MPDEIDKQGIKKDDYNRIDITPMNSARSREELGTLIVDMVLETQSRLVRPYPHELKMTRRQFNILAGRPEDAPPNTPETDSEFFHTKHNIMEIIVDETRTD